MFYENPNDTNTPASPTSTTGLRALLHHLLPRHALFQVRITIHQLASVPLVHGEFGVKWKFKNTHKVKGKGNPKAPELEHDDGDSFGSGEISPEESLTLGVPVHTQSASDSTVFSMDGPQETSSARGQTPWLPLRDHSVLWDQPLSAVVQMSIDRDTHHLLPHPFKLTVLQKVEGDHNPRLGAVHLDLAEYADSVPASSASKGVVTRRYLLEGSKTNATLRLSIRVEPSGTPPPFIAPPLPNGEILAGVTMLLSTHADVYRTRPRALDLYAPMAQDNVQSTAPFDLRVLPRAYGPRPTESLIEALFNPVPVQDARLVSPFTKLVPEGSTLSTTSSSSASLRSTSTSLYSTSGSLSMTPSSSAPSEHLRALNAGLSPGRAHWWNRSRERSRSRSRTRAAAPVAVA
ncbi:N-terminal C2 in EEIG1 and EHBP1 proteins-domain-containing protein [Mycena crocata]|nr:N-terminal C2 in EEIG1 and EHBP1 proteins-domain-containing protein [Mycena crocata]